MSAARKSGLVITDSADACAAQLAEAKSIAREAIESASLANEALVWLGALATAIKNEADAVGEFTGAGEGTPYLPPRKWSDGNPIPPDPILIRTLARVAEYIAGDCGSTLDCERERLRTQLAGVAEASQ